MVLCRFFQHGSCRFGSNCEFEHIYSSQYSYRAPANPTQTSTSYKLTDDHLVGLLQSDINDALVGGQWILSCYAPFKEKACFPGFYDLSQEEARLITYEAKADHILDQAVQYMNNLFKETRQKYQQLLQPSPLILKILRSIYNDEPVSSPFGNQSQGSKGSDIFSNFRNKEIDENVFSKLEELSKSDLEWYKSANFKLGQIPVLPPPRELC